MFAGVAHYFPCDPDRLDAICPGGTVSLSACATFLLEQDQLLVGVGFRNGADLASVPENGFL